MMTGRLVVTGAGGFVGARLTRLALAAGWQVTIVSSDKDLMQLVGKYMFSGGGSSSGANSDAPAADAPAAEEPASTEETP